MFIFFIIMDETRVDGGRKVECVGVMKDKELNLGEIEEKHILCEEGEGRVRSRGK